MFGALSARFGWMPSQIAELTLPQLNGYLRFMGKNPVPLVMMVTPA